MIASGKMTSGFSPQILTLGQESQTLAILKAAEEFENQEKLYKDFYKEQVEEVKIVLLF